MAAVPTALLHGKGEWASPQPSPIEVGIGWEGSNSFFDRFLLRANLMYSVWRYSRYCTVPWCPTGRSLGKSLFLCLVHSEQFTPNWIVPKTRQRQVLPQAAKDTDVVLLLQKLWETRLQIQQLNQSRNLGLWHPGTNAFSPRVHRVFSEQPHWFGSKVSVWIWDSFPNESLIWKLPNPD